MYSCQVLVDRHKSTWTCTGSSSRNPKFFIALVAGTFPQIRRKSLTTGKCRGIRCLDDWATPRLDTVSLRPVPSDAVMIRPTNVYILRQSDPTRVRLADHLHTAQFDPLEEVGLNVGCDNLTHGQSDPFSAPPSGAGTVRSMTKKWRC